MRICYNKAKQICWIVIKFDQNYKSVWIKNEMHGRRQSHG